MSKISIIVPVYNVEDYLKQCLDSLVNQTYKDIEIIVVNDKTPDNSQKIIDEYKRNDSRVVSIIHDVNKGLGGARNTGIQNATGDYIAFLDSDDWLALNTFEKLIEEIDKNGSDIIKFGRIEKFETHETYFSPKLSKLYINGWEELKDSVKEKKYTPICWSSIYKTEFIINNRILFPEKLLFEDFSFTFKAQLSATSISYIDGYYYYWRKDREGSITYTVNLRDIEVCTTLQIIDNFLKENDMDDISNSIDYHYLMYNWSAGTTIYRYLKTSENTKTKDIVISQIVNNEYFSKHLDFIVSSNKIRFTKKFPVYLLKNNLSLFKFAYNVFFNLRNLFGNNKVSKLH